jgi:hypothetical protein
MICDGARLQAEATFPVRAFTATEERFGGTGKPGTSQMPPDDAMMPALVTRCQHDFVKFRCPQLCRSISSGLPFPEQVIVS